MPVIVLWIWGRVAKVAVGAGGGRVLFSKVKYIRSPVLLVSGGGLVWFGLVCPGVGAADRGRCALSPFYVLLPAPTLHKTRAAEPVNNPLTAPWNISSQRTLSIQPPPAPRSIDLEPDQGRCRLPLGAVIVVSLDDDSKRECKL